MFQPANPGDAQPQNNTENLDYNFIHLIFFIQNLWNRPYSSSRATSRNVVCGNITLDKVATSIIHQISGAR